MVFTFNGKDVKVEMFIGLTVEGAIPEDQDVPTTWVDATAVAVGTDVSVNKSKEVSAKHGLNQQTPQLIKEGNITYDWSVGALYTVDAVEAKDLTEMIDAGVTFAMKVTMFEADGSTEASAYVMSYCKCSTNNYEVSQDGDATVSMSGMCKTAAQE